MPQHHRIQSPPLDTNDLAQGKVLFHLMEGDRTLHLRIHDCNQIFLRPGLYEQVLFYDRLKSTSPRYRCSTSGQATA